MLGNWICDDEYNVYVEVSNGYFLNRFLKTCSAIEVTEEMLAKIGFEKHQILKDSFFWRYWDKEHRYKLDVDFDFCNSDRMWSLHIDNGDCNTIGCGEFTYLHELQNFVRVITGHDLPITREML